MSAYSEYRGINIYVVGKVAILKDRNDQEFDRISLPNASEAELMSEAKGQIDEFFQAEREADAVAEEQGEMPYENDYQYAECEDNYPEW